MTLREMWRRVTTTRHAQVLETEVARQRAEIQRLRAENRALLNSILGIAGIPPIVVEDDVSLEARSDLRAPAGLSAKEQAQRAVPQHPEANTVGGGNGRSEARQLAVPLRRRSWQQINRMFEFEAARKSVSSDW